MNRMTFARTAKANGANFRRNADYDVESFSTLDKTPNVGLAGTLTTRTSDVAGVVTTTLSPAGNIASTDKVAIGWVDANGVFQWCWYGTATVSGSAITVATIAGGTALPIATYAVVIAKIAAEPLVIPSTAAKVVVTAPKTSSKMVAILGLTAEVDNGSPDYTNVIRVECEGPQDSGFFESAAEFTAMNADFVSADRAYVANLSTVVGGNIQIVSGFN